MFSECCIVINVLINCFSELLIMIGLNGNSGLCIGAICESANITQCVIIIQKSNLGNIMTMIKIVVVNVNNYNCYY